jgi:hypothetical protein
MSATPTPPVPPTPPTPPPNPIATVKADITSDEAALLAAIRRATTTAEQDGATLIADAKAAGSYLYTALQNVLNGAGNAATGTQAQQATKKA